MKQSSCEKPWKQFYLDLSANVSCELDDVVATTRNACIVLERADSTTEFVAYCPLSLMLRKVIILPWQGLWTEDNNILKDSIEGSNCNVRNWMLSTKSSGLPYFMMQCSIDFKSAKTCFHLLLQSPSELHLSLVSRTKVKLPKSSFHVSHGS